MILPFALLYQSVLAVNGKCRALILSGGSDRGAFQAGAIVGLVNYLPEGEAMWDVVLGNGIGALNALLVSQTVIGEENNLNYTLSNFWLNFKRSMFYKSWWGGKFVGYHFKNGYYNSSPSKYTVSRIFDGSFDRFIQIGVTDLENSDYKIMNSSYFTNDIMLMGVEANLNTFGDFGVIDYQNSQYSSGAIAFEIDFFPAIDYCKSLGYRERDIKVHYILINHAKLRPYDAKGKNSYENKRRFREIQDYNNVFERIRFTQMNSKVQTWVNITMPESIPVDSKYPFDYESNSKNLVSMFNSGIQAAKNSLGL